MWHKIIAAFIVSLSVSCTPAYSATNTLTESGCSAVMKTARTAIIDYRNGLNQFQVMDKINAYPASYWGANNYMAKLYSQVIVIDLRNNVNKGYRNKEILDVVRAACTKKIGLKL